MINVPEDTAGAVAAYLNPEQDQPGRAVKAAVSVAVGDNPDFEAELRKVATRTGVPLESARAFPEDVKRQAQVEANDYDEMARQFPGATKFLANVDNARIAHDDIQNLTQAEATIGPVTGQKPTFASYATGLLKSLPQGAEMARQGIRLQLADLFGQDEVRADAQRKYSQASLESQLSSPDFESSTARGVYGGLSSLVRSVPGLAASIATRSTTPLLATAGIQTETEAYGKYRGRGATAGQALAGAAGEGAIEVATELLPMSYLVNNLGKAGAGSFLSGLLARDIPGEQVATLVQDALDTAIANPDKTWGDYLAERPGAAYETLVATVTQASVMGGANVAMQKVQGKSQQAQQAATTGEALMQFNEVASASKVRERDSTTAQAFFQSLMQDGRDTVWITPQALEESGMAEQLAQALPSVAAQLQQAAETGVEVRIPIAELMATMAGPELAQSIIPHLADEPGGFTQTSANEYLQSGAARELADEVSRTLAEQQTNDAFAESRAQVEAGFVEQLNTAGRFSPDVNKAYASMLGNFFSVQAARLGITPQEMAERYPLQIRADRLVGSKTLDQPDQRTIEVAGQRRAVYDADNKLLAPEAGGQAEFWNWYGNGPVDTQGRPQVQDGTYISESGETRPASALAQPETSPGNARGSLSFADDITTTPSVISLFRGADLSTLSHEAAHFFLEVMNDIASRPDAPADIRDDMDALLKWFDVPDLATWDGYTLEQKRDYHETFARGYEAYLFEGRAPTPELRGLFARFRSWMVNVYRSLSALNVELTDEVRSVYDRMLASADAIAQAEREAGFAGMFGTKPDFMSDEEWQAYRALNLEASEGAVRDLETRSLRDMKWLGNAKAKVLREMQRKHNEERAKIQEEVRREVMAEPVYQAWQFLTIRGGDTTRAWPEPESKLPANVLDTRVDSLYTAIAKLGGLSREEVKTKWGVDHKDIPNSGVFGKPILRKNGGLSIDRMAERLVEEHYLDAHDLAEFEDKFDRERGGQEQFSWEHNWTNGERPTTEPMGDSNYHGKLHTPMLRYMFGEDSDVVKRLIKSRMTSTDGGLDPDVVADLIPGFASGREMVEAILAVPTPSALINQLVDQRMLERFGDLKDEAIITRAVDEALYEKAHLRFLATELNALKKAAGKPAVLASAAKSYAEQIIARTAVRELRPHLFTAAARRAARASETAFKKGDIQEAAAQKQIQTINTFAAAAALEARNNVEATLERFRKISTGSDVRAAKTRDMDMVMATRAILAEFGIGTRGKQATEYLAAVQAYDPGMAMVLRERIDASIENAKPYQDLSVEQLAGLRDEVESLWHLARRSRQMEVDGDLIDRQEVQDELRARMEEIGIPDVVPGEGRAITPGEVAISQLQTLRASLRRVESWADAKDGAGTKMGPFRRFIWNTVKDPADAYRADKAVYLKKLRTLLDPIAPSLKQVKIAAPELGYTFGFDKGGMGKAELLHAVLHTGNAGNKKKLLLGRGWATQNEDGSLDTSRWDSFIARMANQGVLTKDDFDFAQGVWDLLEEMKPLAQKAHREAFGRYFDEVTADTLDTPFGQYRGGYVPAITDSRIVADAKTRAIMEEQTEGMMNVLPTTSKGFTKARVEYNQPLMLDLRTLSQHIDKVLLFSHMEVPIRDVRRILASDTVAKPLHRIDPASYDALLTPWLKRTALQQVESKLDGSNGLMRFFSVVRARAGMAAMFANVSNTAQQITGFSIAALKVKPSYLGGAIVDFMQNPRSMADAVAEASPYMANRMTNEVAAMNDAIGDILLNPGVYDRAIAWTQRHTYFMQSAVDNVMGPIIWHGAYNQAMETAPAGMKPDELELYSRRLADSAVRETQGSTLPEDISRIETGNAFVRLFTQFAGYFNMQANILGTEFSKVAQDTGLRKGAGRGFYIMLFGFFIPAWVAQAIALGFRGGPEDDDKDGSYLDDWLAQTLGWGTLRSATALVPVVGQTTNALANTFNKKPYDDRISTGPAISMIESAVSVPNDVYKLATGTGSQTKTVRDVATLISLTVGIPANAIARPIIYATDVATDKAKPTGPADVARGVVTGVSSPESKGR